MHQYERLPILTFSSERDQLLLWSMSTLVERSWKLDLDSIALPWRKLRSWSLNSFVGQRAEFCDRPQSYSTLPVGNEIGKRKAELRKGAAFGLALGPSPLNS